MYGSVCWSRDINIKIMVKSIWSQENKSGVRFDRPIMWLLLPGVIIQWFLYTFPGGGFGRVVRDTRIARSPLMTYLISILFYLSVWGMLFAFVKS
jgi:hypothetical protein